MEEQSLMVQLQNRWENVYWFARDLINNDKYGGVGKDNKLIATLAGSLRLITAESKAQNLLQLQKQTLKNILITRFQNARSVKQRIGQLVIDLDEKIQTEEDMAVFILTCESIMIPINQAITNIPSDDKEFTYSVAKSYLDIHKNEGLATVIRLWDDLGVRGCLTAERTEIVRAFTTLRTLLSRDSNLQEIDKDIVLTAFTQEFERRAGQKRKSRAGGSLEDVTKFILTYFNIPTAFGPEHFQADIEVDNWVKTKDGWLIGISCKRTLRERWKQVTSADRAVLGKYKIKYIYHVITYDEDLSDDKLALLGSLRHIFYLPDNSRKLESAQNHIGLKDYVRPMTSFISDLKREIKK